MADTPAAIDFTRSNAKLDEVRALLASAVRDPAERIAIYQAVVEYAVTRADECITAMGAAIRATFDRRAA